MARRKITKLRLLSELRKLLNRPDTTVTERAIKECAKADWEYETDSLGNMVNVSSIRITVDPRRDGRVRTVIHELLHIYMAMYIRIDRQMADELEEVAILAWEYKLYDWLHSPKRQAQLASWNKAIERKMT